MPTVTPFLWFDSEALEAAEFYVSVFPNSSITGVSRYGEAGPGTPGSEMTVAFSLDGRAFVALNGGPEHPFTDAVSFVVDCADQAEVDRYWDALLAGGGSTGACGWLRDRFGLWWQVVPSGLPGVLADPDPQRAAAAMRAMLAMSKLDLDALRAAAAGV